MPVSVTSGTALGGFMFDFVRLVAKPFIRTSKTMRPKTVGTPSLLGAFRGAECFAQIVKRVRGAHLGTLMVKFAYSHGRLA